MYQAIVNAWGETPKYTPVPDLPTPGPEEVRIKVEAVGIHRVVRSRALGKHYSSGKPPHIPGIDSVGTTEDGQRVYFSSWAGALSEYINIPKASIHALPKVADPVQVAASLNPAMSSWMAFKSRTTNLPTDFTCLILGATSASGRIAISLARALGAKKVIGAARNPSTLENLGLDKTILIAEDPSETDFSDLDDVDVVIDYVYGPLTSHLFNSLRAPKPVQYVHIGVVSAVTEISLPGAILRSKDITIRGSGHGAWNVKSLEETLPELLKIVPGMPKQPVKVAKMADVETAWNYTGSERLVIVP